MMNCRRCKTGNLQKLYEIKFHDIYQCQDCQYQEIIRLDDCCRDPFKIVVNDTSFFPNFRLYEQCKNCGEAKRNFPLKYTKNIEVRGEFEKWRQLSSVGAIWLFCDLDRIQTCNLLSRNQMRYSVAPRGHCLMVCKYNTFLLSLKDETKNFTINRVFNANGL